MACHGAVAPIAAEASHAGVNEPRVDGGGAQGFGPEVEFLKDARPERVDEDVGGAGEVEDKRAPRRGFEVDGDGGLVAGEGVACWWAWGGLF